MWTSLVVLSVCLLSDTSGAGAGSSEGQADSVRGDVRNLTRKAGEAVKFHCDVHTGIYFVYIYFCLPGSGFALHFLSSSGPDQDLAQRPQTKDLDLGYTLYLI